MRVRLPARPVDRNTKGIVRRHSRETTNDPNPSTHGGPLRSTIWGAVAIIGAWALGVITLQRGEPINAVWLIVAAICVYQSAIATSKFICREGA